jgi:hypothetical protein
MRVWPTIVLGLLVVGCGGNANRPRSEAPGDEPAGTATAASPRAAGPATPARRPPPDPPRSVRTRLVGGPIVLRVEGATHRPLLRYVLIFRLNRRYPRWPKHPGDPEGPAPLPYAAREPIGNVSIASFRFDFERSIFNFDPVRRPDRDNCFSGNLDSDALDTASVVRRLDAIPAGGRVRVRLRLLTPDRRGRPAYGPRYVRHPSIVPARVHSYAGREAADRERFTPGLYLEVTSRAARRALKRIGCAATVLY